MMSVIEEDAAGQAEKDTDSGRCGSPMGLAPSVPLTPPTPYLRDMVGLEWCSLKLTHLGPAAGGAATSVAKRAAFELSGALGVSSRGRRGQIKGGFYSRALMLRNPDFPGQM